MKIAISELASDGESTREIARIENGDVLYGEDDIEGVIFEDELDDPEFLLDHFNGPRVFADRVPEADVQKEWVPYTGDRGGEGWLHQESGEVRYQDDKPREPERHLPEDVEYDDGDDGASRAAESDESDDVSFVGHMETVNPSNVQAGQYAVLQLPGKPTLAHIARIGETDDGEREYHYRTSAGETGTFRDTDSLVGIVSPDMAEEHFDGYGLGENARLDTTYDPSSLQPGDEILVDQGVETARARVTNVDRSLVDRGRFSVDFERVDGGAIGTFRVDDPEINAPDDDSPYMGRVYGEQYHRGATPERGFEADETIEGVGVSTLPEATESRRENMEVLSDRLRYGDTVLCDRRDGGTQRLMLTDMSGVAEGYGVTGYTEAGEKVTVHTVGRGEAKLHGRVVAGDETLDGLSDDAVRRAADEVDPDVRRWSEKGVGGFLVDMVRLDADDDVVAESLRELYERSSAANGSVVYMHRSAADALSELTLVDTEYGRSSLGEVEQSTVGDFEADLKEDMEPAEWEAHESTDHQWVTGNMHGTDTMPMWQKAEEITGNSHALKNERELFERVVDEQAGAGFDQYRDRMQEFLRDAYGDTIPVFKGIKARSRRLEGVREDLENDRPVTFRQLGIDSWAFDPHSAEEFAFGNDGIVIRREMPVENIMTTSQTSGTLYNSENEAVCANPEYLTVQPDDINFPRRDDDSGGDAAEQALDHVRWAYRSLQQRGVVKAAEDESEPEDEEPNYRKPKAYDFTAESSGWIRRVGNGRHGEDENNDGDVGGSGDGAMDETGSGAESDGEALSESFDVERAHAMTTGGDSSIEKIGSRERFEQLDECLLKAFADQVCVDDVRKAPVSWEGDEDVPQYVREFVSDAATKATFHDDYENIPHAAALEVHRILRDSLTDSQGWSVGQITRDLVTEFEGMDHAQAKTVVLTEVGGVLNTARSMAFEAYDDDPEVVWSGPDDIYTTDLCTAVKARIEDRGGYVKKSELRRILVDEARSHLDEGGLPDRARTFVPHYNCRHTFTRKEFRWIDLGV